MTKKFKVTRKINSGGFGTVYEVADSAGRPYALKELKPDAPDGEKAPKRFAREVRIQSSLQHTNIVELRA